jgi:hypothetical protein
VIFSLSQLVPSPSGRLAAGEAAADEQGPSSVCRQWLRVAKLATCQRAASRPDFDEERLALYLWQLVRQVVPLAGRRRGCPGFRGARGRGEDVNLAGVWLVLVTLPGSLLASPVAGLASGRLSTVIFFGALVVSALINAAVISIAYSPSGRLSDVFKFAQKAFPPNSANSPLWDEDQ